MTAGTAAAGAAHPAGWRCRPAHWLEVAVEDDGCGITPEVLDRMFDPFYSTKELGRGSGMGLAMVHGIVHDHGGHLRVDTAPGEGSTFRVMLPPASAGSAQQVLQADPADGGVVAGASTLRGRVLVVEDQAMVGDFMSELLGSWGLEVVLHRDPLQALEWLQDRSQVLDLVITDQTMPRMTGVELASRIATQREDLPVLLYTGDAARYDTAELWRCGVHRLLRKPIDPKVLRSTIQALLRASATP